jgi:ribosomal protein S18 acetylase RimI-like enzyme
MSGSPFAMIELTRDKIRPASQMLSRAFQESPVYIYAYPNADIRKKNLPRAFESVLRYGMKYGRVTTTSDRMEGVLVWTRPESMKMTVGRMWRSGALWPAVRIGIRASVRMSRINDFIEKKHRELAPFDHWYLLLLGVDPVYQRKGYGGRLLRSMLVAADVAGLPCYLETTTEENVAFYRHFGFGVIDEFMVPGTPVKIWVMLRGEQLNVEHTR